MADYFLRKKALEDLSEIWNYAYEEWSEAQADKYYSMLIAACEELGRKKVSGKPYPAVHEEIYGYKTGQHIIFYRHRAGEKLEVVRILHFRMDIKNRIAM